MNIITPEGCACICNLEMIKVVGGFTGALVRQIKGGLTHGWSSLSKPLTVGNLIVGCVSGFHYGSDFFTSFMAGLSGSYVVDNGGKILVKNRDKIPVKISKK